MSVKHSMLSGIGLTWREKNGRASAGTLALAQSTFPPAARVTRERVSPLLPFSDAHDIDAFLAAVNRLRRFRRACARGASHRCVARGRTGMARRAGVVLVVRARFVADGVQQDCFHWMGHWRSGHRLHGRERSYDVGHFDLWHGVMARDAAFAVGPARYGYGGGIAGWRVRWTVPAGIGRALAGGGGCRLCDRCARLSRFCCVVAGHCEAGSSAADVGRGLGGGDCWLVWRQGAE